MYSSIKKNVSPIQKLKQTVGGWMFGILSQMTRDQFCTILQTMDSEPKLLPIKERILSIRASYEELQQHCTENQLPYIGKPFFYGIKYNTSTSDTGLVTSQIVFDVDNTTQRQADVGERINSAKEFSSFANLIASALVPEHQKKELIDQLSHEELLIREALQSINTPDAEIDEDDYETQLPEPNSSKDSNNRELSNGQDSEVDEEETPKVSKAAFGKRLDFKTSADKAKERKAAAVEVVRAVISEQSSKKGAAARVEEALLRANRMRK